MLRVPVRRSGSPPGSPTAWTPTASVWDGANVYKVVRTTDTSRYICRKDDTEPPVFLTAPAAGEAEGQARQARRRVTATINEAGTIAVFGKIKIKGIRVKGLSVLNEVRTAAPGELVTG